MTQYRLTLDPSHTAIEFAATYAMNSIVKGQFTEFEGIIYLDTDDLSKSSAQATIEAASIDTRLGERDVHLRSADFLDADSNPRIEFVSTSAEVAGENSWNITGDLTIGESTRPVNLNATYFGIVTDAMGTTRAGFVAETDINRSDWGLTWNAEQSTGVLVSDRIRITLYVSAVPAKPSDE